MSLAIPIPPEHLKDLRTALDRVARSRWEEDGVIHVVSLEQNIDFLQYCRDNDIRCILVPYRVHCNEDALRKAAYTVYPERSERPDYTISKLIDGSKLQEFLRKLGLDWRGALVNQLKLYSHPNEGQRIDERIDPWLKQFDRLGCDRAI